MSDTPIADVSDTALWVAAFRALESERNDALFKDPLAAYLVGERGRDIARKMPYPKMLAWLMAVRTVAIDRLILTALADGVDTVVNIGAGLDTRPYRMDVPSSLQWIEIDFPHMIDLKNMKLVDERPRCQLRRIGLDVANREIATKTYAEVGAQAKRALVITEGVIIYLSNDDAAQLARDLRAVPSFHYWIQDYRKSTGALREPTKLKDKLRHAPFRFNHKDPLGLFAAQGWKAKVNILGLDEGDKIGRPFPIPFPFNFLTWMVPKERQQAMRESMGYVLLEAQ